MEHPIQFWKFTSAEAFKSVLKTKTVRVSPAIDLNDPGEFKFRVDTYSDADFRNDLNDGVSLPRLSPALSAFMGRSICSASDFTEAEKDKLYAYIKRQVEILGKNSGRMRFDLSRLFAVFSCSSYPRDPTSPFPPHLENLEMWAHYASNHSGVAYSLNENFFEEKSAFLPIEYDNTPPTFKPSLKEVEQLFPAIGWGPDEDGFFEKMVCTKHTRWRYESESRVLYPLSKAEYNVEKDMYFAKIRHEVLDTVIFGCRTKEKDIREILHFSKMQLGRKPNYAKAWGFPNSYTLQRIPFPISE